MYVYSPIWRDLPYLSDSKTALGDSTKTLTYLNGWFAQKFGGQESILLLERLNDDDYLTTQRCEEVHERTVDKKETRLG
jgi:hypothetical protein